MDVSAAGKALLLGALALAVWSVLASSLGSRRRDRRLAASGERALFATGLLLAAATALMVYALFSRNFSIQYVYDYTNRATSPMYTLVALWAGMEGSLLFWTLLTAMFGVSAILVQRKRRPDLTPVATAVLAGNLVFLVGMLIFGANPFDPMSPIPGDGRGFNPLLQSPYMAIHPVLLYLGMTGFVVPFAFAVSSLVTGRLEAGWFTSTRRWTVVAWTFLTVGILLGGAWAYKELGWGGYWAWDPVENASLLPWLTGTAFLHSVMIQERRQMLKIWNVALILGTYCLAIFGTFLTRSGLLSSVHTFAESPVGKMFLPFLGVMVVGAFGLLGWRYEKLRSRRHLETMFSREAMFLFNNLLLVTMALTVLWGTLYPIIVEAFTGAKISVGPPFFNAVIIPLSLALVALTGIGPLVAWRRASWPNVRRQLLVPLAGGAATMLSLALNGVRSAGALFGLGLVVFVGIATIGEFARGARAHRSPGRLGLLRGLVTVVLANRRRYGGYIVHLGVVLICLGISGNAFRLAWSGDLVPGDRFSIGRYDVTYVQPETSTDAERLIRVAVMDVRQDGRPVAELRPERNLHLAQDQVRSEIGLRSTLTDDLYLALTQIQDNGTVTVRAWVNPLVIWIWIGGALMAAGMVVIISGRPPEQRDPEPGAGRTGRSVPVPA